MSRFLALFILVVAFLVGIWLIGMVLKRVVVGGPLRRQPCPHAGCGHPNPHNASYCARCGRELFRE